MDPTVRHPLPVADISNAFPRPLRFPAVVYHWINNSSDPATREEFACDDPLLAERLSLPPPDHMSRWVNFECIFQAGPAAYPNNVRIPQKFIGVVETFFLARRYGKILLRHLAPDARVTIKRVDAHTFFLLSATFHPADVDWESDFRNKHREQTGFFVDALQRTIVTLQAGVL